MNINRYYVFCHDTFYPEGGMADCVGKFSDLKEAIEFVMSVRGDSKYIYDVVTEKYVDMIHRANGVSFVGDWESLADMVRDFEIEATLLNGAQILFAYYGQASYDGEAFVLLRRGSLLYEVNASHCSCYGLEGQWEEEQCTVKELIHRIDVGYLGRSSYAPDFSQELKSIILSIANEIEDELKF